jgi:WD40 repeat protein
VKLKGYDLKAVISEAESYRVQNSLITRGHKAAVNCVIELLDGRLCSCGDDKMIKFWDPVRCVCDLTMEGHWAAVNCVVQLRSGLLCTCGNDRMIKLWHLTRFTKKSISTPDDHCVLTLTGHAGVVRKVAERRNGTLISCGDDNTVRIWAPEPG